MTILEREPVRVFRNPYEQRVWVKKERSNQRDQGLMIRGLGRCKETDRRKALGWSTVTPMVLSLIGSIHADPDLR